MGSASKTAHRTAKNASKLHKMIGKLLTEHSLFSGYEIRQEYRVSKVNPDFKSNREKFDWVVLGLKIIIEAHGEQHYRPVCFGGITKQEAAERFKKQQQRDEEKKLAAEAAGWTYIVVRYDEKDITEDDLFERIANNMTDASTAVKQKPKQKIPTRAKYNWPKRKLQSRPFNYKKKQ